MSSLHHLYHTARWHPRMRKKTGCFPCRKKRKKCDEVNGICGACSRTNTVCVWPADPSVDSPTTVEAPSNHAAVSLTIPASPSSNEVVELQLRNVLFSQFASTVMVQILRPHVPPAFADHNRFYFFGAHHPALMNACLVCAALSVSKFHPAFGDIAMRRYCASIKITRALLEANACDGNEEWLTTLACSLCVFERWQNYSQSQTMAHLQAAAQWLIFKRNDVAKNLHRGITPFQRLFAESVLYNATATIFLAAEISWLSYETF